MRQQSRSAREAERRLRSREIIAGNTNSMDPRLNRRRIAAWQEKQTFIKKYNNFKELRNKTLLLLLNNCSIRLPQEQTLLYILLFK